MRWDSGLRLRCCRRFQMLLGRLGQKRKTFRVAHGHVRKNLAVKINTAYLQSVDQLAVAEAVVAGRSSDALNPERPVIALPHTPVAIGITKRAVDRFFRRAVELSLSEEKSLGVLQQLFAFCAAFCTAFYTRHGSSPLARRFGTLET